MPIAGTFKFDGYLEDALQNRLVCGHRDESVKYWLLTEPKLTLAKTIELAQGMETAARDKQEMKWAVMAIKKVATPPVKVHWQGAHLACITVNRV